MSPAERWQAGAAYRAMAASFAEAPADDPEAAAAHLVRLLGVSDWAAALLAPLIEALAADPDFEPPWRVTRDAGRVAAALYQCRAGSITATLTSATAMATLPAPASIVFSGRMTVTRTIRAGGATLRRWQVGADPSACCQPMPALALTDGAVHQVDGRREASQLAEARSDVVTLTASLAAGAAPLMRQYDIASHAPIRVGHADDRCSRVEILLALLRASGRSDAAPCFEAATHDALFALRWAAMREWVALDARAALPRLAEMAACDSHAEVRAAARHTLPLVEARCRG